MPEIPDKECLEQLCKTSKKTVIRVLRLTAPIANCPDYDSDDSDTSTLGGEDTVDEAITVLSDLSMSRIYIWMT